MTTNEFASGTLGAREDWEKITGQKYRLLPYRFDLDGKEYVSFIMGAAYPVFDKDGCVLVLGIVPDTHQIQVVDCVRCSGVYDVYQKIVELRAKYGYGLLSAHLDMVIGDEERYQSVVAKVSEEIEKRQGENAGIYFCNPADFEMTGCMGMYLNHLKQAMAEGDVDHCNNQVVTDELRLLNAEEVQKGRYQDYPVPGLFAAMVHTILYEEQNKEEHHPHLNDDRGERVFISDDI